jgi:hypothetical protein
VLRAGEESSSEALTVLPVHLVLILKPLSPQFAVPAWFWHMQQTRASSGQFGSANELFDGVC